MTFFSSKKYIPLIKKNKIIKLKKQNLITLLNWRNEGFVRRNSLNPGKITIEQHKKWIKKKLKIKKNKIYIYYVLKQPTGMCSIIKKKKYFYLSYSIDKNFRGQSHSKKMLKLFLKKIKTKFYKNKIFANVLLNNIKSIKILNDLNFLKFSSNRKYIKLKLS